MSPTTTIWVIFMAIYLATFTGLMLLLWYLCAERIKEWREHHNDWT